MDPGHAPAILVQEAFQPNGLAFISRGASPWESWPKAQLPFARASLSRLVRSVECRSMDRFTSPTAYSLSWAKWTDNRENLDKGYLCAYSRWLNGGAIEVLGELREQGFCLAVRF